MSLPWLDPLLHHHKTFIGQRQTKSMLPIRATFPQLQNIRPRSGSGHRSLRPYKLLISALQALDTVRRNRLLNILCHPLRAHIVRNHNPLLDLVLDQEIWLWREMEHRITASILPPLFHPLPQLRHTRQTKVRPSSINNCNSANPPDFLPVFRHPTWVSFAKAQSH